MLRSGARTLVGCAIACLLVTVGLVAAGDLRLVDAVKSQDKDLTRALLKQRLDVNARQGDGSTALHWAAHWNDLDTAALLIGAGGNVNAATDLGVTPLYLAAEVGSGPMVQKLLASGADPNVPTSTGITPLMLASRAGSIDAVKAMIGRKANVNAKEADQGQTALMWAASRGHADVVQALAQAGADVHAKTKASTMFLNRGDSDSGDNVPSGANSALMFAARSGNVESVKALLESGADVNDAAADGNSALVVAAHSGNGAVARFLLEKGANPNADGAGYTVLHAAVLRGDLELLRAALARGANPNVQYTKATPMYRQSPHFFLTAALVGATPLVQAAQYGDAEMMRTLVAAGASLTIAAKDGTVPLTAAAVADHHLRQAAKYRMDGDDRQEVEGLAAVKTLLELGADINAVNGAGNTALHVAAGAKANTIVQLLAEKGAQLEAKNKRGQTPLALASGGGGRGNRGAGGAGANSTADLLRKLGAKE